MTNMAEEYERIKKELRVQTFALHAPLPWAASSRRQKLPTLLACALVASKVDNALFGQALSVRAYQNFFAMVWSVVL
ncbi:hypothetical protein N7461_000323 [Penicillium sp. DV-2018c]|nr:hypothetical protein N7461_000323 [Penicillium sp. DV-2018c]